MLQLSKNSLLVTFFTVFVTLVSAQGIQTLSGSFQNNTENTIICPCNSQALLSYVNSNGERKLITLCFDTEPGDFYQIYDGEVITVTGNVFCNITCNNGQKYCVMYVKKSEMQMIQRQMIVPEFLKQQNKSLPSELNQSKSKQTYSYTGSYTQKHSTKDTWDGFDGCNNCGTLNIRTQNNQGDINYERIKISFDKVNNHPGNSFGQIKVEGYFENNFFYATKWSLTN